MSGAALSTLKILAQVMHPTAFTDEETEAERGKELAFDGRARMQSSHSQP